MRTGQEMEGRPLSLSGSRRFAVPLLAVVALISCLCSGCALFVGSNVLKVPTVSITANPTSVAVSQTSILTISATDALQITVTGSDGTTYSFPKTGGVQAVKPTATTTYTVTATNSKGSSTATATVTV